MALHQRFLQWLTAAVLGSGFGAPVLALDAGHVVTSIKPVHSLVSAVMAGVGEPGLLIRGKDSPHTFSLRPSDAQMLKDARLIVLIGEAMETSLVGPIDTLASHASVIELSETPGLILKPVRAGGLFEGHDHNHHHGHHHGTHDDRHEDEKMAKHDAFDMHLWPDPVNAMAMVPVIADALSETDPANGAIYEANAQELLKQLEALTSEIDADLALVRDVPFIVFHDAYQYFEDRFGLNAVASIRVSAQHAPGIRRIQELRSKVRDLGVACVLAEPQFDQGLVDVVIEGTAARSGTIDPLGAAIKSGPDLYFTLLRNMASSIKMCLAP